MIEPSCNNPIHDGGSNEWLSMHAINNQHAAGEGKTTADDGGREIRETREGEGRGLLLIVSKVRGGGSGILYNHHAAPGERK